MPPVGAGPDALREWAAEMVGLYPACALRHNELVESVEEHNGA